MPIYKPPRFNAKPPRKFKPEPVPKMQWGHLADGNCPSCTGRLHYNEDTMIYNCRCGFKISDGKLREITSRNAEQSYTTQYRRGRDNLSPEERDQARLNDL